ncbi:hypothetical protein C8R45DRAFT_1212466 [Mycena sanguinolenta]|nr:hypothetical protein C8R45DRAFT_1212466 [Mycena sanguinolenta]
MSHHSSVSPPPRSVGPLRTQISPQRSTPYPRGHRSSQNENYEPIGPGHAGNFHSQYLPYPGSTPSTGYESYDRIPLSMVQNRLPAVASVVNVDELSTEFGLNSSQRKAAHAFLKMGSEDRAMRLFLRLLHMERQNGEILAQLQQIGSRFESTEAFCMQSWKPSPEQTKLLKSLLRHYIIRPVTSYSNLVELVETYILDHSAALRLGLYKEEATVKTVVNGLLVKENGNIRSALRKLVWASLTARVSLEAFTKKVIEAYHLPVIPAQPPQDIMACMALMRKVAEPLVPNETQRSGDTGFWKNLEKALDDLFDKNGKRRDSPDVGISSRSLAVTAAADNLRWLKWEEEIIKKDNLKYNRSAVESNARTQQEIDAALLPTSCDADNAASANAESGDQDRVGTHEDRGVHISGLGNLAALASGPVVRSDV